MNLSAATNIMFLDLINYEINMHKKSTCRVEQVLRKLMMVTDIKSRLRGKVYSGEVFS